VDGTVGTAENRRDDVEARPPSPPSDVTPRSKIRSRSTGRTPGPSSATVTTTRSPSRWPVTRIVGSSAECCTALFRRVVKTGLSARVSTASRVSGRSVSTVASSSDSLAVSTASSSTGSRSIGSGSASSRRTFETARTSSRSSVSVSTCFVRARPDSLTRSSSVASTISAWPCMIWSPLSTSCQSRLLVKAIASRTSLARATSSLWLS
jgi:hypothetical protein